MAIAGDENSSTAGDHAHADGACRNAHRPGAPVGVTLPG
jgi:hypothetical protein